MSTPLPSNWTMALLRNSGAFVCQCLCPVRISLTLWKSTECARCGKLVVP